VRSSSCLRSRGTRSGGAAVGQRDVASPWAFTQASTQSRCDASSKLRSQMSTIAHALVSVLSMALAMGWEILWPLILGFALSGVVQAVVTEGEMSRLLPDFSLRSIAIATALGAASSSCSYAAVALARSMGPILSRRWPSSSPRPIWSSNLGSSSQR
jgi:hypothetical protein